MSLLQSAKLHGHDPWAYLKDVLTRLPSHMNSRINELLPHRWQPQLCTDNAVKVPWADAYQKPDCAMCAGANSAGLRD